MVSIQITPVGVCMPVIGQSKIRAKTWPMLQPADMIEITHEHVWAICLKINHAAHFLRTHV